EATEQLWEAAILDRAAGVEERAQDLRGPSRVAVSGEARSHQRVVVRPDRPIVVAHRIGPRRALGERPQPPPGPDVVLEQPVEGALRPRTLRDPAEQALAGVGRDHPARAMVAVESQREHAHVVEPEIPVELLAQPSRTPLA